MGIRRVTSSSPCLASVMRVQKSVLKSAAGAASKYIRILNRMSMKLQSNLGGFMCVQIKLFKGLQSVQMTPTTPNRMIAELLLGGLQLILGPVVFTGFGPHKMDVPLFWKELASLRVANLGSRRSGCGTS
eukprot:1154515-Pelagomonas_calceolata.AAC.2